MTTERYRAEIARAFGYEGLPADWQGMLERSLEPRAPDMLYDVAAKAGLGAGDTVLEAGCRSSDHSLRLVDRFGCEVVGVDIVARGLREGIAASKSDGAPIEFAQADLELLPFRESSFEFVWCRDVLEMVEDPVRVLSEFRRVMKPGAGMMLYVAFLTTDLSDTERSRLALALGEPLARIEQRTVEDLLASLGFHVIEKESVSPEWLEHDLEHNIDDARWSFLTVARMRRARAHFEQAFGREWYERLYAWALWAPYLLLGKIQTVAWALRAPG